MENSEKHNVNLGVNKSRKKNIKKKCLQQTTQVRSNIIPRHRFPQSEEVQNVNKDDFKSFIQRMTGRKINHSKPPIENTKLQKNQSPQLSIVRPQVPLQVSAWAPIAPPLASKNALLAHPLQPYFGRSKPPIENARLQKNRPPPLSIVRPQVPFQVPSCAPIAPPLASNNALHAHPLQPDFGHSKRQIENTRLQKHRPPPLSIVRPHVPFQVPCWAPIAPPLASNNALSAHPLQPDFGHSKRPVENTRLQKHRPPPLSVVRTQVPFQVLAGAPIAPPIASNNVLSAHPLQSGSGHSQPLVENTRLQKNRPPPLSIVRPQVPLQVPAWAPIAPPLASNNALSAHPLQPDSGHPLVENSQTNNVESPISVFMRNFEGSTMDFGNSSGNQFDPFASQTEITNNVNVKPPDLASQTQVGNDIVPYQFSSSLSPDPLLTTIATNQTFPMNNGNQVVNGLPSPQSNDPQSPTSEFPMYSPTSNMNLVSPQTFYSPLLSPNLFSSPSSPNFPFYPYLQNNGISTSYPESPLSAEIFPFSSMNK